MRMALKGLLGTALLAALTGCGGVAGHWTLESIQPEPPAAGFHLNMMCLAEDGRYCAMAKEGEQTRQMTGTYKYDRDAKTLAFAMEGGQERSYKAQLLCPGSRLKVWSETPGKEWTAFMKRAPCSACQKCGGPACRCCPARSAQACPVESCPMRKPPAEKAAAPAPADRK